MESDKPAAAALEATLLSQSRIEAPQSDPIVGTTLKHFQVARLLGKGGMGAVYLAHDLSLDRPVALKVLAPEIAHDPDVVARFVREARTQARVRHPNVAQIYFIGEERGLHFFVMEYLEGTAIDVVLANGQSIPWPEALEHIITAARGLRAAALLGFIHRDVKPSNLMLDGDAGLKIVDFGLAKTIHGSAELTRQGAIIGSPLYMSPEQGQGKEVDLRTDVYSLGCSLYHMVTGRPPFTADSPVGVITKHITERADPVRAIVPEIPEPLEVLVDRMMSKDPKDRFQTYDALIEAASRARPNERELSGFRRRAFALAVDLSPVVIAALALGPWIVPWPPIYFVASHRLFGRTLGKWVFGLEVTDHEGRRLSWLASALRFLVFAWGPIVLGIVGAVGARLGQLSVRKLEAPFVYVSIAAAISVAYLIGFLIAAFHPKKLALHDLVARSEVRYRASRKVAKVARMIRSTTSKLRISSQ